MRTWVYQTLKSSGIWAPLGGRLYSTSRMTQVPDKKPYGFYRIGVTTGLLHSDAPARATPFQLFIHDEPGDFLQIDSLLEIAKDALTAYPPPFLDGIGQKVIRCTWLDHSSDGTEDPLTGTISRFSRYSLVHLS